MISWRKLMGSGQMLVPNLIFIAAIRCCPQSVNLDSPTPNNGNQGTDVAVILTGNFNDGCGGIPHIFIDGAGNGINSGEGVSTNFDVNVDPWDYGHIPCTLHIDANAATGHHWINVATAVFAGNIKTVSGSVNFWVSSPGRPPPPDLLVVSKQDGFPLLPGGPLPVTFGFWGTHLLNNNPQLHIDGPGITFPSGPLPVQTNGLYDWFLLPITADRNATPGDHSVWVRTNGGTSNIMTLTVTAPQRGSGPGGSHPFLDSISPTRVNVYYNYPNAAPYIELHGSGFGTHRRVVMTPADGCQPCAIELYPDTNYEPTPDSLVVIPFRPDLFASFQPFATVQVHNLDNDTVSGPLYLIVDDLDPNMPNVTGGSGGVYRDYDADVVVTGQNLDVTQQPVISGIPGLTFSNVQADPNYPAGTALDFHVHADVQGPVTGEIATNLHISTVSGQSNEFGFNVVQPPFPRPVINNITPARITKPPGSSIRVSFKFDGTGFGTSRAITVDPNNSIQYVSALGTNQANPDVVVVGLASDWVAGSDTSITLHVHNLDHDTVSYGSPVVLDEPVPGAPVVSSAYASLRQNGDGDLSVGGQNLQGVNEQNLQQSFSGISGLTFSNYQSGPDPSQGFSVHIHADANAPLSGDEPTNLVITTADGQSNPFWIEIDPLLPP